MIKTVSCHFRIIGLVTLLPKLDNIVDKHYENASMYLSAAINQNQTNLRYAIGIFMTSTQLDDEILIKFSSILFGLNEFHRKEKVHSEKLTTKDSVVYIRAI